MSRAVVASWPSALAAARPSASARQSSRTPKILIHHRPAGLTGTPTRLVQVPAAATPVSPSSNASAAPGGRSGALFVFILPTGLTRGCQKDSEWATQVNALLDDRRRGGDGDVGRRIGSWYQQMARRPGQFGFGTICAFRRIRGVIPTNPGTPGRRSRERPTQGRRYPLMITSSSLLSGWSRTAPSSTCWESGGHDAFGAAQRLMPAQLDAVGVVDQAVEDGCGVTYSSAGRLLGVGSADG